MKATLFASAALSGLFSLSASAADPPAGPARDVPELQALHHWAGNWNAESTTKPTADIPKGARAKGTARGEWVLEGRYLQQTWIIEAGPGMPGMSGRTLMTYDPRKKTYRNWTFVSNGFTSEAEGVWNARTRTMTWTSRDAESGNTTITTASIPEEGIETWSIVTRDRENKVLAETTGKNTRRKE
jgi:hypothetical protein